MSTRLFAALLTSIRSDILLIDEGIGVGHLAFQNKFAKRLDNFLYSASILIFASHSFELLKQYCKQGLVLKHGEIMFQGNIEEAISIYKKDLRGLMSPAASILIATFNRPEKLKRAVRSVLRQTYTNYEIIIIDDASETQH